MSKAEKLKKYTSSFVKSIFEIAITKNDKIKKYKLARPLKVNVYSKGNLFFVENSDIVIVGTSNFVNTAIDDFCKHVIHFYNYYKTLSINKITGDAIRLKKLYETIIRKIETKNLIQKSEELQ